MSSSELKVLLIGESDVGKSNILLRFTQNVFSADFIPTMGTDFLSKEIQIPDKEDTVRLNIWDTAGQERFRWVHFNILVKTRFVSKQNMLTIEL
ncbi:MAG: GTP-binding protein [Cytophagales bacterium]|nr:GTP-binding protein [Cytophagales bacterium]